MEFRFNSTNSRFGDISAIHSSDLDTKIGSKKDIGKLNFNSTSLRRNSDETAKNEFNVSPLKRTGLDSGLKRSSFEKSEDKSYGLGKNSFDTGNYDFGNTSGLRRQSNDSNNSSNSNNSNNVSRLKKTNLESGLRRSSFEKSGDKSHGLRKNSFDNGNTSGLRRHSNDSNNSNTRSNSSGHYKCSFVRLVKHQIGNLDRRYCCYLHDIERGNSFQARLWRYRYVLLGIPFLLLIMWSTLLLGALIGSVFCNGQRDCPFAKGVNMSPRTLYAPRSVF